VALFVFLVIPLNLGFAQQFDPLEKLNNSTILVDGKILLLTSDIEIRQFANSHIVKIQGEATTGEILIIFLKDNNVNFQKVMVVSDGQFHKGSLIPKVESITEPEEEKQSYIPDLIITSSNDSKTYWNTNFNIDVQVFDGKINPDPKSHEFDGRVNDVDITVIISLGDEIITTLKGVTSNGHWEGEYLIEYLSPPGEYNVDILASYGNQTVSKSTSMFVLAYFASGPVSSG